MIEVKPCKIDDLEYFDNDSGLSKEDIKNAILFSNEHKEFRTMFSLWDEDIVVSIIGMNVIVKGVFEFYVIKSKHTSSKALEMWKEIDFALDSFFSTNLMHRAQIAVSIDNTKYIKFLERFKFFPEGIMKNYYGDGKDQMLLARI